MEDQERYEQMIRRAVAMDRKYPMKSDGGPTGYYDLDPSWVTMNDMMEHRAKAQWKEYSLHFKDIEKALARFRMKEGTSDLYDLKKIAYSSIRALGMSIGKDGVRDYLQQLLDDPQFK